MACIFVLSPSSSLVNVSLPSHFVYLRQRWARACHLLPHGLAARLELKVDAVFVGLRRGRRRRAVEEVRGDVEEVHPGAAAGILGPEVELQGHCLARRMRSGVHDAVDDGEAQGLRAEHHLQGGDDDGDDEHGHHGRHRVPRRVQAPERRGLAVVQPVRLVVFGL